LKRINARKKERKKILSFASQSDVLRAFGNRAESVLAMSVIEVLIRGDRIETDIPCLCTQLINTL
jgi:hypothetical protein